MEIQTDSSPNSRDEDSQASVTTRMLQSHASGPSDETPQQIDSAHMTDAVLRRVELQDESKLTKLSLPYSRVV